MTNDHSLYWPYPASIEIHDHSQVVPFPLRPDAADATAPNLVWLGNIKLTIQCIWNARSLNRCFFVGMRARLLAAQPQFPHPATHLVTPDLLAIFLHHRHDTAAASSASALCKQFVDSTAELNSLNSRRSPPEAMGVVSRTGGFEHLAQAVNRFMGA